MLPSFERISFLNKRTFGNDLVDIGNLFHNLIAFYKNEQKTRDEWIRGILILREQLNLVGYAWLTVFWLARSTNLVLCSIFTNL